MDAIGVNGEQGRSRSRRLFVATIYISPRQSGSFFSPKGEWNSIIQHANAFIPTVVLLDADKKLVAIGSEAEEKYRQTDFDKTAMYYFSDVDIGRMNVSNKILLGWPWYTSNWPIEAEESSWEERAANENE